MLSPRNWRNEVKCQSDVSKFCVFQKQGRHLGRESIHWLIDVELKYAHVHVLINCTKVKSYFEYVIISFVNNFVVNYI